MRSVLMVLFFAALITACTKIEDPLLNGRLPVPDAAPLPELKEVP